MKNPKNQVGKMSEIFQREKRQNFDICPRRTVTFLPKNPILQISTAKLENQLKITCCLVSFLDKF